MTTGDRSVDADGPFMDEAWRRSARSDEEEAGRLGVASGNVGVGNGVALESGLSELSGGMDETLTKLVAEVSV